MKILIIQAKIGMGDMIIYLPYIHAISKKYNEKVSILVKENSRASELLVDDEHIDEIIILDRKKDKTGFHDGIKGFFELANELKEKKFEKVFIFNSSLRYFLIAKLAKVKKIAQYPLFIKRDNIVTSAKIFTESEIQNVVSTQPSLKLDKNKIKNAKDLMPNKFKHICLGVSASGPTKRWDISNYLNLCKKLSAYTPSKFYLAGGKNDEELIKKILDSKIGLNCKSFTKLSISETLPIIKNCDLCISNDTGWLHIASALGVKCVALFMDSPALAYGKYSKNFKLILPKGESEETTTHDTLGKDRIMLSEVYEQSIKLLN